MYQKCSLNTKEPDQHSRASRREDAAVLAGLMTQLGYPATPAAMRLRLEALLQHAECKTFAAEEGGVVVGMAGACLSLAYEKDGLYGRLLALVVETDRRGRGTGERWDDSGFILVFQKHGFQVEG